MMERRTFLGMAAGSLLAVPLAAEAQPAGKVWRIGAVSLGAAPTKPGLFRGLLYPDILRDPLRPPQPRLDGHKHTFSQVVRLDAQGNGDTGSSAEHDKALRHVEHDPA